MRLGIDFGTTHTVAALVDRGNFPVVPLGEHDVCPSLLAAHDDGRLKLRPRRRRGGARAGLALSALDEAAAPRRGPA